MAVFTGKPFLLAPLAGYTDLPFRLLCRELGASMVYSEMISCHGLIFAQRQTLSLLASCPQERPVAFQIFGSDPLIMGQAARLLDQYPIDCIDINMGCPVRKVIKKGAGAALMRDLCRADEIIRAVRAATKLPVSVKFRSGWLATEETAPEFAQMAQEAGASTIIVHARSWSQGFSGQANWQVIGRVKNQVKIPVIGNGDVLCYQDGLRMLEETGCDGVMVGRGALGNPWVFQESGRPASLAARLPVMYRFLELTAAHGNPALMLCRIKNHLSRFCSGLPGATTLRPQLYACRSFSELTDYMKQLMESPLSRGGGENDSIR